MLPGTVYEEAENTVLIIVKSIKLRGYSVILMRRILWEDVQWKTSMLGRLIKSDLRKISV